jgi:hypothetical protein
MRAQANRGATDSDMGDPPKINECRRPKWQNNLPDDCRMSEVTQKKQLHCGYVDITAMIRSLQRTEGFTDCFRTGLSDCDQITCAWRQYCLHMPDGLPSKK